MTDGRYVNKFASENIISLSSRILSKAKISFLSTKLKFVPTPTAFNRGIFKGELKTSSRKLCFFFFFFFLFRTTDYKTKKDKYNTQYLR